ncbi:S-adenosyl-L-methionine-dependent methyltransferase, partial [Gloeophyllum trabeum ATCC 11539]
MSTSISSRRKLLASNAMQSFTSAALRITAEAKISDHLLGHPDGLHVSELSSRSGIEAGRLSRVLRLLATQHCYREVTDDPVSHYIAITTDESMKCIVQLNQTFKDAEYATSDSADKSAFTRVFGMHYFAYLGSATDTFAKAMIGAGEIMNKGALAKAYPWSTLHKDAVICDVGGGNGHMSMLLMKQFPHMKAVIQDQPSFMNIAQQVNLSRDTFICDITIRHDWPDAECIVILENVRRAMKPSSKLLIREEIDQSLIQMMTLLSDEFICRPVAATTTANAMEQRANRGAPRRLGVGTEVGGKLGLGRDGFGGDVPCVGWESSDWLTAFGLCHYSSQTWLYSAGAQSSVYEPLFKEPPPRLVGCLSGSVGSFSHPYF